VFQRHALLGTKQNGLGSAQIKHGDYLTGRRALAGVKRQTVTRRYVEPNGDNPSIEGRA